MEYYAGVLPHIGRIAIPQVTRFKATKAPTTARLTSHLILVHHIVVDSLDTATPIHTSTQTVDSTTGGHRPVATLVTFNGLLPTLGAMTAHPQVPGMHLAARLHRQILTSHLLSFMKAPIRSDQ